MKVLLADDSVLILERLQYILRMFQQVEIVGTFANGTDTLEALKVKKPDLAIVDIKMPGMSGLDVLKEIRKVNKAMRFIILTFYTTDYYRDLALKEGVDYFFSKSEDFERVSQVVEEMVQREENNKIKSKPN